MAVIKCKMCGGAINIGSESVATCEYCGTQQTLPKLGDDRRVTLYERAGHFRRNNEYDKAMGIYEQILSEDLTDAESYWSLVLCRYGIEYVEDPATRKRIPTVNRAQFTSVFDDENYQSALRYADRFQRQIYEAEAKTINEIQKGILEISQKEEPFDIFICYKETDANGRRTPDSVLATELYHQLTQEGFKVFFSRITLEDKLGTAYEPYIFAALNSAKVMIVLGTKQEYFNAVWVKNEWSRYLSLIQNGEDKILIPAYRDMDPYDMPEEFSHLQAQDMGKLGFTQDLIRGVKKIAQGPKAAAVKETVITTGKLDTAALLKRAFMCLEDGEWKAADEICEQVLNIDPECAEGYLGKLLAELHVHTQAELKDCAEPFDRLGSYRKAIRFADDELRKNLSGYVRDINERKEKLRFAREEREEKGRKKHKKLPMIAAAIACAAALFVILRSTAASPDDRYREAIGLMEAGQYTEAIAAFNALDGYQDSEDKIAECENAILDKAYHDALALAEAGQYDAAIDAFETLNGYKGSADQIAAVALEKKYSASAALKEAGDILGALRGFGELGNYKDAPLQAAALRALYQENLRKTSISAGSAHTVALKNNGSVVAAGSDNSGQCGVFAWKNIVAVSAGGSHTAGLKEDGAALAAGSNGAGQCDVSAWKDIVAISAGGSHTVGLKANGTVVAVGHNDRCQCNVSDWKDIVAISAGDGHTVGLKADGTVVAVGQNNHGQCDVADWTDIIAVSAGDAHTVGLKSDGTVVAVGRNSRDLCDVSAWQDIIAVSAGSWHTVGLKIDGTVVAVGYNEYGQCNVSGWTDIITISAGDSHTVGLKMDGSTMIAGGYEQQGVSGWTDIRLPG